MSRTNPKKQKKPTFRRRRKIPLLIVGAGTLAIVGYVAYKEITKQLEIQRQQTVLNQTIPDISQLYYRFSDAIDQPKELTRRPENRCTKISAKSTIKSYTCGTRANLEVTTSSEAAFDNLRQKFEPTIIQEVFAVDRVTAKKEVESENSINVQYLLTHKASRQKCNVYAAYYKLERISSYSFTCNLNTAHQIFELDN